MLATNHLLSEYCRKLEILDTINTKKWYFNANLQKDIRIIDSNFEKLIEMVYKIRDILRSEILTCNELSLLDSDLNRFETTTKQLMYTFSSIEELKLLSKFFGKLLGLIQKIVKSPTIKLLIHVSSTTDDDGHTTTHYEYSEFQVCFLDEEILVDLVSLIEPYIKEDILISQQTSFEHIDSLDVLLKLLYLSHRYIKPNQCYATKNAVMTLWGLLSHNFGQNLPWLHKIPLFFELNANLGPAIQKFRLLFKTKDYSLNKPIKLQNLFGWKSEVKDLNFLLGRIILKLGSNHMIADIR